MAIVSKNFGGHGPFCSPLATPMFYTHSLYSLLWTTMCHCNGHKLYQRCPETEQFITATYPATR